MASRSLAQQQRQFDVPLSLAPAFAIFRVPVPSRKSFSTSLRWCVSHKRDKNKKRGVSAIRSTGPRVPLGVYKYPLPSPIDDANRRNQFKTSQTHGLWGFFGEDKRAMISPEDEAAFGRPWTYQELSVKDWDDLYKLYWTSILELNRTATRAGEMKRLHAGYGGNESDSRMKCIGTTLRNIRSVLRDRHVNYTEARHVLEGHEDAAELLADPEITEEDHDQGMEDDEPALLESNNESLAREAYSPNAVQQPNASSPAAR